MTRPTRANFRQLQIPSRPTVAESQEDPRAASPVESYNGATSLNGTLDSVADLQLKVVCAT
jgi:hypothetical protein